MKVLHVIPSVSPIRGGPSQAVLELVIALRGCGIESEIVTTNDDGSSLLNVPLNQRIEYQGVPVWFFPRFSPQLQSLREYAFSRQFTTWLWQHITEYELVHIHAIFSYTCTAAMAIARLKNIPYLVRPNGLLCNWSLKQSALRKEIYLALIERANLNRSLAVELTSLQEQEEVTPLQIKANRCIIPYGLSVPARIPDARQRLRQLLQITEDEPVVLFMSRIHHKKGLEYLIPALQQIAHRRFTFVLAGSGSPEYEVEIAALLKASGVHDRTYFAGFVEGETKELFLQGADIFALTSHSESFGLAVLEAIAAGLSIVTTPGVPLATVVEQYQLGQVIKLDSDAIAKALQQCLDSLQDFQQTQCRQDRARQLISEHYTWECIATKLIEIYNDIINKQFTSIEVS